MAKRGHPAGTRIGVYQRRRPIDVGHQRKRMMENWSSRDDTPGDASDWESVWGTPWGDRGHRVMPLGGA